MSSPSKPTVWITRTLPAANESAKAWQAAGAETIIQPLLTVAPIHDYAEPPAGSVVIFTSKNGVDHFRGRAHRVICVGDATANHARAAGFRDVVSVNGTSKDVTAWVLANLPKTEIITHVSGRHVRGKITEDLCQAGYDASRIIVYQSRKVFHSPAQNFDVIALYSPLAAEVFSVVSSGWVQPNMRIFSISPATNEAILHFPDDQRFIADHPTEAAMLDLLNPLRTT